MRKNPNAARRSKWLSFLGRIPSISHLMIRGSSRNIKLLRTIKDALSTCARMRGCNWRANHRSCLLVFAIDNAPTTSTRPYPETCVNMRCRFLHVAATESGEAVLNTSRYSLFQAPDPPEFHRSHVKS